MTDILDILKNNSAHIVGNIFRNVQRNEETLLNEMYNMIVYDIDINFDSKSFYLLKYEFCNISKLYFDIDYKRTPKELLEMIIKLVEQRRMDQNIKNKLYLIHFRGFKGKVYLENQNNDLRRELFLQLHHFIREPLKIRIFLLRKLLKVKNELKNKLIDENEMIQLKIQEYRIKLILKSIEKQTILVN